MLATTGSGFNIAWIFAAGTNYTSATPQTTWGGWPGNPGFAAGQSVNVASSANNYWRITGIQLELGDIATPFEHRSFTEELVRCYRYYNRVYDTEGQSGEKPASLGVYEYGSAVTTIFNFPKMRTVPSLDITNGTNKFMIRSDSNSDHFSTMSLRYGTTTTAEITQSSGVSGNSGHSGFIRGADADVYIAFSAEL